MVHHKQTSVGQLKPDHLHLPGGLLPPRILMPEEEVSAGPEGDGGYGASGSQFSFIISVLSDVVIAIFIPAVRTQAQFTKQPSPGPCQQGRVPTFLQRDRCHEQPLLWVCKGRRASSGSAEEPSLKHFHSILSCLIVCFKMELTKSSQKLILGFSRFMCVNL